MVSGSGSPPAASEVPRGQRGQGQALRPRADRAAGRRGLLRRGRRCFANALADGLPADGVITGQRDDRRPPGLPDGQRLHRQGRAAGAPARSRRSSGSSSGRTTTGVPMVYLVDSAGARITDQVDLFPGRRGAGQHLLQPGPRVRLASRRSARCSGRPPPAAPTSRPSATSSRWSTATPRCTSAPTAWSRWSPARRPRSRRWAARGSTATESGVGHFLCKAEAEALDVVRRYLSYLPSNWTAAAAGGRGRGRQEASTSPRWSRPASARPSTCAVRQGPGRRAASFFEIQALLGPGADRRLRPARRRGRRRRRQQLAVQGRRAVRRLGRQGDPVRAALRRVQRAAAVPRRRARLHGRHRGGEAGHHPARRQDDHRDHRGDRAEDLRRGAQGVRRRASTRWPAPASSPTPRSRCPPRRSP